MRPAPCPPLLYLDYDGVLHHEDVRRYRDRGIVVAHGHLFEHAPVLERLLAPYPALRIVLSTSWVRALGFHRSKGYLPPALSSRVVGATTHTSMRLSEMGVRGAEVWGDVQRRRAHPRWVAIDDDDYGWNELARPHLVLSHPERALGDSEVAAKLASALATYCSTTQ